MAWALRQAGYQITGADVAIDADLPAGAGLSSSAALECATALALTELHQVPVPRPELAALARRAENDFAGVPSGIMDQIAALLSRAGHALLLDCRTGTGTPVPLDPAAAGLALLVIDTRAGHAVGDGRYAERRQACEQAAAALHVRSLRDVTDAGQLTRLSGDPALQRLAGHVLAEQRRVLRAADLLLAGHQASLGPLLTASHHSLRDRFRFSWPQADEAVAAAIEAGAKGARMTGGGFGGSVIALIPIDRATQVRENVTARFTRRHWPAPHFLDAVPSAAARRLIG
jgi:galactokinase